MDKNKEKIKSNFDHEASAYDNSKASQFAKQSYPYMLNTLMPIRFETVLDVGCGTGSLLYEILDRKPQVKAVGVDFSEEMLKVARDKLPKRVELIQGDAEAIPFENKRFDVVVGSDILRYTTNPQLMIREMYRVLKVGGKIVLCDFCTASSLRAVKNLFNPLSKDGGLRIYAEDEVKEFLSKSGFDFVNYTKVTGNTFIATGDKRN
ncbi:class I SAM-dependent methyltransferase [Cellulosilyticum lentocellum]|uniref:Methyltransferase type 11 n=1 Tax=Cellulosilyticum lentocellum (strain ATCC 49066 / DSM 5427 / NCIMB 11756 / RHM5) TaxID=642492 RepID=F2JJL2_CELLD|nr:methyltransferase domain-containing protein [Cellulosilyticum lentocellum]ADZ82054.1 Methyltransferase type 11 [Cellulosilyticum lentocellum DSM 5427]